MCMCRPTRSRPCSSSFLMAPSRFSCQMPCLLDSPPVFVLREWPWPKPGFTRSQTGWPRRRRPTWSSMSSEPAFTGMPSVDDALERRRVDHVRGVDQLGGLAAGPEARAQRALDLAERNGVHQRALLAHQPQHVQVRAGLLRVAHHVEGGERADALADHVGDSRRSRACRSVSASVADLRRVDAFVRAVIRASRACARRGDVPHPATHGAGRCRIAAAAALWW